MLDSCGRCVILVAIRTYGRFCLLARTSGASTRVAMTKRKRRGPGSSGRPAAGSGPGHLLWWTLAIVVVGLLMRFGYIAEVRHHPLMTAAAGDALVYDLRALEIADGKWLADDVFFHSSPLYPYFLGLVYAIFGHSYVAVRILQSIIGVGSCLLIFSIARSGLGSRQGVIAGLVAALYAPFIFFDSELLMISIVIFFSLLALRLLLRHSGTRSPWMALVAGLCLGVGALGKPNLLLFLPPAMAWLWWMARRGKQTSRPFLAPILLAAGTVLAIAPITISNSVIADDFVLTSSNGGINFFIGNSEEAEGTFLIYRNMRSDLYGGSRDYAERELGRELKPSEVSQYWFRRGLEFIREHPGQELRLISRKFLLFWNAYEIPNHYSIYFFKRLSKILRFDPVLWSWVIPLGFLGIYVSRRRWREHLLLYLFAGAYFLSLLPFFITARYRLPVVPVMIVFCGEGALWLWNKLRRRERSGWTRPLAVLVVALIVVHLPIVGFTFAHQYSLLGEIHRKAGRFEEAADAYRAAIREEPDHDMAHSNLGSLLGRMKRYDEAEKELRQAIALNPTSAAAHSNLGNILVQTGRLDEALESLGLAVSIDPDHRPAWENMGRAAILVDDSALAVRAIEEILRLDPSDANAHWNLALLYARDPRRTDAAVDHARRAAELSPELRSEAAEFISSLTSPAESLPHPRRSP
jgi:tetratricopeptide (TPR) repeat protein